MDKIKAFSVPVKEHQQRKLKELMLKHNFRYYHQILQYLLDKE